MCTHRIGLEQATDEGLSLSVRNLHIGDDRRSHRGHDRSAVSLGLVEAMSLLGRRELPVIRLLGVDRARTGSLPSHSCTACGSDETQWAGIALTSFTITPLAGLDSPITASAPGYHPYCNYNTSSGGVFSSCSWGRRGAFRC